MGVCFQVYRLYQLSKAAHFIDILMHAMKEAPVTPTLDIVERGGALVAMIVTFQVLGLLCLWSLVTFLMRLFPSRPVADNYWYAYLPLLHFIVVVWIVESGKCFSKLCLECGEEKGRKSR